MPHYRLGCRPSLPDLRDKPASLLLGAPPDTLPSAVDRRQELGPCWDQGDEGSCTAFSSGAAFRHARRKRHGWPLPGQWSDSIHYGKAEDYRISEQCQYWFSRSLEGSTGSDAGASIRDAIAALHRFGACAWHNYPYVAGQFAQTPPAAAIRNAGHHEIATYYALDGTVGGYKHALFAACLPVIGIAVYASFFDTGGDGNVPAPSGQVEGGHAVCLVGYDDAHQNADGTTGAVCFRNSWGSAWASNGHGWLSYAYVTNAQLTFDAWLISVGAP